MKNNKPVKAYPLIENQEGYCGTWSEAPVYERKRKHASLHLVQTNNKDS